MYHNPDGKFCDCHQESGLHLFDDGVCTPDGTTSIRTNDNAGWALIAFKRAVDCGYTHVTMAVYPTGAQVGSHQE